MGYVFNYKVEAECAANSRDRVHKHFQDALQCALQELSNPNSRIILDYPVKPEPHWTDKPHPRLNEMFTASMADFRQRLESYLPLVATLRKEDLLWQNRWFEGLDAFMAYAIVATHKPKRVIEIGSGFSTTFLAAARKRWSPKTHITSIDPHPRAEIDALCNQVVRKPFEETDPTEIYAQLEPNDVLFIDSSHRVFTNSDVTTLFLDVIPYLRPGVIIHVHDIFLPRDYPADWNGRYYSEQYLLASYLLGGTSGAQVIMPNYFVAQNELVPAEIAAFNTTGSSFWMRKI
jgi:hypothetical protein